MICPDTPALVDMMAHLLPRGRAWGAVWRDGSTMRRFFEAVAASLAVLEARLCAVREEWFCASSTRATRDWWMTDHGLPDACDPYPDPCVKRAATAATRCERWVALAAAAGWSITCHEVRPCGARAGAGRVGGRLGGAGDRWPGPTVVVTVDLPASPAYVAPRFAPARAGRYRSGQAVGCGPDLSPLVCLLERLIPDHVAREWRTIDV